MNCSDCLGSFCLIFEISFFSCPGVNQCCFGLSASGTFVFSSPIMRLIGRRSAFTFCRPSFSFSDGLSLDVFCISASRFVTSLRTVLHWFGVDFVWSLKLKSISPFLSWSYQCSLVCLPLRPLFRYLLKWDKPSFPSLTAPPLELSALRLQHLLNHSV